MTIILFLVDNSVSMNQVSYQRISFLGYAQHAIETILKYRSRDPNARGFDRYMLLTFDRPPKNIKAGWKESQTVFMEELRNLKAENSSSITAPLSSAFHLLNVNRLQSGIDNFGYGRYPQWLEQAFVILFTDGHSFVDDDGTLFDIDKIRLSSYGSELYYDAYRWDQRIYAVVLRIPGILPRKQYMGGPVPPCHGPIEAICERTGGRSYCITDHKMINPCIESLMMKMHTGVVMSFERYEVMPTRFEMPKSSGSALMALIASEPGTVIRSPDSCPASPLFTPDPIWHKTKGMIYVPRLPNRGYMASHWPIPEAFWPDSTMTYLPPRTAHPMIRFQCYQYMPMLLEEFPFDKYELEPTALTKHMLEVTTPAICWYAFVMNSSKTNDIGAPFGYLKVSSSMNCVNLYVLPYDFPSLFPLIEEARRNPPAIMTQNWRCHFDNYLRNIPAYYFLPLKKALLRISVLRPVCEMFFENWLPPNINVYLSKIKTYAKEEYIALCQQVGQKMITEDYVAVINNNFQRPVYLHPTLDNVTERYLEPPILLQSLTETKPAQLTAEQVLRYPERLTRDNLLEGVVLLFDLISENMDFGENSSMQPLNESFMLDNQHTVPVMMMGNYQEYLKRMPPPLREVEPTPPRLHAFGNPFKVDKRISVDEADISANPQTGDRFFRRDAEIREKGPLSKTYRWIPRGGPVTLPFRKHECSGCSTLINTIGFCTNCQIKQAAKLKPETEVVISEIVEEERKEEQVEEEDDEEEDDDEEDDKEEEEQFVSPSSQAKRKATSHVFYDFTEKQNLAVDNTFFQINERLRLIVREPVRDFQRLLDFLNNQEPDVLKKLIRNALEEARRLKMKELYEFLIEQFLT
ncbi:Integrator complex subunit 6-A [Trichinella nelsoni]|uniref:Integrator complex subunit 6-A n=1 Tax=Trichinella nelsoni TaxID=6336 RepID=A0A0V0RTT6_9BILA|nr:Integrator complex subunit 6-A [Trichinella nelsoni]